MTYPILYSAKGERYIDHINRCLEKFDIIFPIWEPTIKRIFSISKNDNIGNLLKEMIIFHDLGKLTKRWQERIGTNKKLPSHAPIGAAYLYKNFSKKNVSEDLKNAISFAVAIHHTDKGLLSDNIERPDVQAINDGIVDFNGKILWHEGRKNLSNAYFPFDAENLNVYDLKEMAKGLRVWAKGCGLLEQHKRRLQASLVHHILKLCDISAATERKEYQKKNGQDYYGGWFMVENIKSYVDKISSRLRALELHAELRRWVEVLKSKYNPQMLILFGSFSQERIKRWSDIDLIIVKETDKPFFERIKEVLLLLKPRVGVDILVYTPEEFKNMYNSREFFRKEIIEKGVKLYERGS